MPLDIFIDCLVDNNFERLIKRGKANDYILLSNWENIFIEYCELSGTTHFKKMLSLMREIGSLKSRLMAIDTCIYVLANKYSFYCVTTLRKLGYDYKFDRNNFADYVKDIELVNNKKKTIELTIAQKETEYSNLLQESKDANIDRVFFDKQLIILSKWIGFSLRKREITVSEYVSILKNYTEEINNTIRNEQ